MAQITHGVRSILSHPLVYSSFQSLMGADAVRRRLVADYVRPFAGMKVLDVGCGPADILAYFPEVDYWGYDISAAYIAQASARFGRTGRLICKELQRADLDSLPKFDVVLALGLLHHLNDDVAAELLQLAHDALRPGGRLVTMDPCLVDGQNPVARFIIRNDRGQNVRTRDQYRALAEGVFSAPRVDVRHRAWIPYTHCYMECER